MSELSSASLLGSAGHTSYIRLVLEVDRLVEEDVTVVGHPRAVAVAIPDGATTHRLRAVNRM